VLAVLGVIAASLILAACGGSSSPSNAAANEQSKEQKAEAKFADFAKCLREHGVNAETATAPGGHGHGLRIKGAGGPAKVEAAQNACKKYQPQPEKVNLSPQQKVEHEEAVQKFAKCMREHGIKVEASTQGGGIQVRIGGPTGSGGPNPESPAFQTAQKDCSGLLPGPKKGVPGGGPPGGGPSTGGAHAGGGEEASLATGGGG
jgi:hypothetical protein